MPAAEARTSPLPLPSGPAAAPSPPLPLSRLVMLRTLPVAVGFLALALMAGLVTAQRDADDEVDGALATARLSRYLSNLPQLNDVQAMTVLRNSAELRHLELRVIDGEGQTLLGADHAIAATEPSVAWTVARPVGRPWTVTLAAAPGPAWGLDLMSALRGLALFGLGFAAMLAVMHWSLSRALAPLAALLAAIRALQRRDGEPLRRLPRMPAAELEQLGTALRQLAVTLEQSERMRRTAGLQAQVLQEDERQRLAGSLLGGFGQRFSALRVDTIWLRRRLAGDGQVEPVVSGMLSQLSLMSQGLGSLVAQLDPLARVAPDDSGSEYQPPQRLRELLQELVDDWSATESDGAQCRLQFSADAASVPRSVMLAVFRMSQEALRNVARHARAQEVCLRVCIDRREGTLSWSVDDDGRGLPGPPDQGLRLARSRGNGLSGLQERALAFGGELVAGTGSRGRGLRLSAVLPLEPA